jgi:ribose-phosphate pyrophosphokinase
LLGRTLAPSLQWVRSGTAHVPRLHAFADSLALARRIARAAGLACAPVRVHRFPDGESLVRVATPAGRDAYLVRSLDDPNSKLVEVMLAVDALRRGGAKTVTLVASYLPYMRQDAVFRCGEPLSQRVVGEWLGSAFDGVVTVQAHLHRVDSLCEVVPGASRSLSAARPIGDWIGRDAGTCVIGPDEESRSWIEPIACPIGASFAIAAKKRRGDAAVTVRLPRLPNGCRAVIVDDIASSGATIAATARAARRAGAAVVDAVVVHAIFAAGAERRIQAAGVRRLASCDTIPHATNAITVAPLLAAALAPGRRARVATAADGALRGGTRVGHGISDIRGRRRDR